ISIERANNLRLQCNLPAGNGRVDLLKEATQIIWDRLPMASKGIVETVDDVLQAVCGNSLPFTGKAFLDISGFRQVVPVVLGGNCRQTI
ncbi:hypothetical protein BX070DRAFT_179604, partial [Coemansia spiralis]